MLYAVFNTYVKVSVTNSGNVDASAKSGRQPSMDCTETSYDEC